MLQAQVAASRRREVQRLDAIREVRSESIIKSRAHWEQQAQNAIDRTASQGSKYRVRIARDANLHERRDRLRHKLDAETKRFVQELAGREETPQMKRERMLLRARVIKERTEADRLKFVERAYEQQFRLGCDELRATQSDLLGTHCKGIQEEQLKQKGLSHHFQREQDLKYDKLWNEDMKRKAQRERDDIERQLKIQRETNEAIENQLDDLRQRQHAAEEHREAEKQLRLTLEQRMCQEQQENRARQQALFAQKRQEAIEYVQQSHDERLQAAEQEKQLDKAYIEDVLARETREKQQELDKKNMATQDVAGFLDYMRKAKESRLNRERQLDILRQREFDAELRRRDERLQKEHEARQNLTAQVMRERRSQIGLQQSRLQQRKLEGELERQRIVDEHAALEAQEKDTERAKINTRTQIQSEQRKQIDEKTRSKQSLIEDASDDRTHMKVEHERYEQRVAAMRRLDAERTKLFGAETGSLIEKQHTAYSYPRKKLIT